MKEHIILEKAKRYEVSINNKNPDGCTYKSKEGFWIENISNKAMMKSDNPKKPTSKKCDTILLK